MTTTSSDYVTEQELLDYITSVKETGNPALQTAISAASRAVDAYCDRIFYMLDSTLYYSACPNELASYWFLDVDDIATTSGLVVKSDTAGDGTYATTLTLNTHFVLTPVNQQFGSIVGYPYTGLRAKQPLIFPIRYFPWQPDTVQIQGTFGWAAVPDPVKQATKIIAAQYFKLAEAPLGVAGWGAYGDIRVRDIPQASTLLMPYRRGSSFGIG